MIKGEKANVAQARSEDFEAQSQLSYLSFFLIIHYLKVRILLTGYNQNRGFHNILCTEGSPRQLHLAHCSRSK